MSIADKLTTIAENEQKVYNSGHTKGYDEGKIQGRVDGLNFYGSACKDGFTERTISTTVDNDGNLSFGYGQNKQKIRGITSAWINKNNYKVTYVGLKWNGRLIHTESPNPPLPIENYFGQNFYFSNPNLSDVHYPDQVIVQLSYHGSGEAFYISNLKTSIGTIDSNISPDLWGENPSDGISKEPDKSSEPDISSSELKFDYCSRARVNLVGSNDTAGLSASFAMDFTYEPDAQVSIRLVQGDAKSNSNDDKILTLLTVSGVSNTLDIQTSATGNFETLATLSPNTEYKLRIESGIGDDTYQLYLNGKGLFKTPRAVLRSGAVFQPVFLEVYNEARARVPIGVIQKS